MEMQKETAVARIENLLLALWVGSLVAIGYIAAPVLFKILDKQQAGQLAGEMFAIVSVLGMAVGLLLIISVLVREGGQGVRHWRFWLLLGMFILVLVHFFGLQPSMAALKADGLVPGSDEARRFGMLHGISALSWLLQSVFGVVLVMAQLRGGRRIQRRSDFHYL